MTTPANPTASPALTRTRPLANGSPSGPTISTASWASKSPSAPTTPAPSNDVPRSRTARSAPASTRMTPSAPTAKAIQTFRAASRVGRGSTTVPTPARPAMASATTSARSAAAITVRTPDHDAILAAASLVAMPPLPRWLPAPPATRSRCWSTVWISSISDASASSRGSAVSTPAVSVSSTNRSAPASWATSAAMRSLSPKRISSLASASFSLTMGTAPSSSRCPRVARACRYCRRTTKS